MSDTSISDTSTPATPLPTSRPPTSRPPNKPAPPLPNTWQPLLKRLHFYGGILIAPFLILAAITGGLYAVAPTLETFVYSDQLHTDSTGTPLALSQQVSNAINTRPDLTVAAVRPAAEPGATTRVLFTDPALGDSEKLAVFIDPVTGESLGQLPAYGSSGALPLRTWISRMHANLNLGDTGRVYSELAASWLWVIALGGVILWISHYRRTRRANPDRARLATIDRTSKGRARTLNWHGAMGVWIAAGLIFLSATGLTWSQFAGDNIGELRSALSWTTPTLTSDLSGQPAPAGGSHGHGHGGGSSAGSDANPESIATNVSRLDAVLATASRIGVKDAVQVTIPSTDTTAFVVSETRAAWQLSPNSVAVDGANGSVVDVSWFADWPLAAQLTSWGISLHMGLLFGLLSQLVLLALAVVLIAIILRGYQMWWQRRPRDGSRPVGRVPQRGGWRRVPIVPGVAVLLVAAVIAWYIPLLGISLAAFLVGDVAIGLWGWWKQRDNRHATL